MAVQRVDVFLGDRIDLQHNLALTIPVAPNSVRKARDGRLISFHRGAKRGALVQLPQVDDDVTRRRGIDAENDALISLSIEWNAAFKRRGDLNVKGPRRHLLGEAIFTDQVPNAALFKPHLPEAGQGTCTVLLG
uniref:Uncharacterized protein n=1 Tax=Candidatus Nitrotoga fabula TaxID=2182327 RepID=A0A2X0QZU2_9PROT|nr:protein of unknown function [Candidatus Nitrotoga fabula]